MSIRIAEDDKSKHHASSPARTVGPCLERRPQATAAPPPHHPQRDRGEATSSSVSEYWETWIASQTPEYGIRGEPTNRPIPPPPPRVRVRRSRFAAPARSRRAPHGRGHHNPPLPPRKGAWSTPRAYHRSLARRCLRTAAAASLSRMLFAWSLTRIGAPDSWSLVSDQSAVETKGDRRPRDDVIGATFLGVGAMVGAGIFALLGHPAGRLGGAAFVPARWGDRIAARLHVVKLGVRHPSSGGFVAYLVEAFGIRSSASPRGCSTSC